MELDGSYEAVLIEHAPTAAARGLDALLLSTPLTAYDPHTDTVHVEKRILRTTTYKDIHHSSIFIKII